MKKIHTPERIQKLIANAGYTSRRQAERLIEQQRITLNNKVAILGDKATLDDTITIDGRKLNLDRYSVDQVRVIMLNKQAGYICSKKDEKGRKSVFDLLSKDTRWVMVGRLDLNTSGLLFFTNSGDLAHKLMHPSSEVEREYSVRVLGEVLPEHLKQLTTGIELEDGFAKFDKVSFVGGEGANSWYKVILKEGRNREVRRMWEHLGFQVSRLIRTGFAGFALPGNLRANQLLELKPHQVQRLENL
jgi:23S rRNA pseudouridine2605 synthase